MAVRSLTGHYSFPSRSRAELYGDDQLVHVLWRGNPFLASAATFRVPRTMTFTDFMTTVVEPWAAGDPDFRPGTERAYQLDMADFDPDPARPLAELGVGHKSLVSFEADSDGIDQRRA